jgi:nucleoside-diphosphate-sugar epimerase
LLSDDEITYSDRVDCIVHCAGIVHFRDAGIKNETMALKVASFARGRGIPVYFASTAFLYRPPAADAPFRNAYEEDKHRAEEVIRASGVPHAVLRPSVLSGSTQDGRLRNYSGYYLLAKAFLEAAGAAKAQGRALRFPNMGGHSDLVPVDQVATHITDRVEAGRLGMSYITNPDPPAANWLLAETLDYFGIADTVDIVDVPFDDFATLALTEEEARLYTFASHFSPYWTMTYRFPDSVCTENLIDRAYLTRTLEAFAKDTQHGYA